MEAWLFITGYVCLFGCFKEIRPAAHFLTQYLEGPWVNLTHSQVNNEVYPVWTYSYLIFLPMVFLFTVCVRYKPFIVLESLALVLTWVLLTWGKGLFTMQMMQVTFGLATASDVAYYTYIYAKVPKSKYRKITSFTRAAVWVGKLMSATLAQALVSSHVMDYFTLNYLSLACVLVSFCLALFLPRTSKKPPPDDDCDLEAKERLSQMAAEGEKEAKAEEVTKSKLKSGVLAKSEKEEEKLSLAESYKKAFLVMREELKRCYRNKPLLQWSIWWALATCGNYQVSNYVQPLWEEIYPARYHENLYHGAVDAVKMSLGIVITLAMGFVKIDWNKYGEFVLGLVSLVESAMLFIMAKTSDIWIAYLTICFFKVLHQMLITIASFQVAKDLSQNTRPLVYGCNTFASVILHAIFTVIVVDKRGLSLNPRPQFIVYSSYFFLMGLVFLVILIFKTWHRCRRQTVRRHTDRNETLQTEQTVALQGGSEQTVEC